MTSTFMVIASYGLLSPSSVYFDETHYVPAARNLLELVSANQEHPLLAKEIIAASIALLGDSSLAWRLPSLLVGGIGLFAFGRLVWWVSRRRFATITAVILLATNFLWFIHSRIAMLDIFAASLLIVGLWQMAAAICGQSGNLRLRLFAAGTLFGLALGAKWSVAPLLPLPFLACLIYLWRGHRVDFAGNQMPFEPPRRISTRQLIEISAYLIVLPTAIYWLTYFPAFFYRPSDTAVLPYDIIGHHLTMIGKQASAVSTHPYQSAWSDWIVNRRPVWYLYEHVDGAQRGVLLLGNPFTMLVGLPAILWCCFAGLRQGRGDASLFAVLYLVSLGFWIVAAKPVQFYYHYLLPATFMMGCLAIALDALRSKQGKWPWLAWTAIIVANAMFVWFYPIISAVPLRQGGSAFETWMWLDSWR